MLQVEQRAARRAVRRLVLRTPVFVHRTVLACPMDPETGAVVGSPTWHAEVEYVAQLVSRTQLRSSLSRKQASHVTSVPGLDPLSTSSPGTVSWCPFRVMRRVFSWVGRLRGVRCFRCWSRLASGGTGR